VRRPEPSDVAAGRECDGAAAEEGRRWSAEHHDSVMRKKAAWEPKWLQKPVRPLLRIEDGTTE
jgi:hypothetical protein